jgi:20S proteasome subunit beta 7
MIMPSMVMACMIVVIIVVVMIIVISMIVVVVMIIVISMIVVVVVVVMVVMVVVIVDMDFAVEVLRFSPNQRRSDSSLDGQTATRTQTPLEYSTEQSIKGVMLGLVVEILFKTSMPLESHDRSKFKFTSLRYISTATMGTVGNRGSGLNQWQKK